MLIFLEKKSRKKFFLAILYDLEIKIQSTHITRDSSRCDVLDSLFNMKLHTTFCMLLFYLGEENVNFLLQKFDVNTELENEMQGGNLIHQFV